MSGLSATSRPGDADRHFGDLLPPSTFLTVLLLAAAPVAAPEQFFVGRTEGVGVANVIMSGKHGVRVRSHGRMDGGTLVLDQVVQEEGKPARRRVWRLVRSGNRLSGTLSDARGPVTGDIAGNVFHIRYRSNEGPSVEQWITFQPGGRTASNRMVFRKFGMSVATVQETIRRVD
jgi:hypothetical protein